MSSRRFLKSNADLKKGLAVLVGLSAIAFSTGCALAQGDPLSPSELNDHVARYDGQTVVVRGLVKLSPEGHVLYESKEKDAEFAEGLEPGSQNFDISQFQKYCLTIANPDFLYRNSRRVVGKTLVVKGRFIDGYPGEGRIDLGRCPLPTAIIIDQDDLRRRYPSLLRVK